MKRILLASTALAFIAGPALAADLPSRQPAPAPQTFTAPPVFTWTGFYAGVNLGWNQNEMSVRNRGFTGDASPGSYNPFSSRTNSFIGGFQVGYNQQFDMFVAGVEADLSYLGNRRSTGSAAVTGGGQSTGVMATSRLDWLGTVRARAGVAMDQVFVYGTGGLAFGAPDQRLNVMNNNTTVATGRNSDTRVGWTLGAGAEFAVMDNLSFKAEYLYYDLGRTTVRATGAGGTNAARFENKGHIVRAGMNYRF
ncbi:MAG: porin family protein [Salinarimonas sp.]|nr:porin family protein [Salinarimonas sp.]